jgi:hypothetical protein
MKPKDLPLFRDEGAKKLVGQICTKHGIKQSLLQNLLEIQRSYAGSGRQKGISDDFGTALSEYLESEEA